MQQSRIQSPQVLVCQRGARHRYAIPRMLEESGVLTALYTDSTGYSSIGRLASTLGRLGLGSSKMGALRSRIPLGIPREKVFTSDRPLYASMLGNMVSPDLSETFARWGLRGANVLYNMYGEHLAFLVWAKSQGCKIIVDVFVHPNFMQTVAEESLVFLGEQDDAKEVVESYRAHSEKTFKVADILLCPSEWVARGIRENFPDYAHKIRIVPYGSSLEKNQSINQNVSVGRILFAGREALRKGLHYLAKAASLLRAQGCVLDVRVAGVSARELDWMEHKDELNCLGPLPMDSMRDEFRQADVFVLPSLTEGQAGVILEAMACGCPVIATREGGVDVEPGCGITVPARNAEALAQAIMNVIGDRDHRNQLARGALRQAESFSMEKWKERLVGVVRDAVEC